MNEPMYQTDFPELTLLNRGKVRDNYDLGDKMLMVMSDRVSAYDCVMPDPVPGKGKVLTKISEMWFNLTGSIIPNHLITTDVSLYPEICQQYADQLIGRSMLVEKAQPLPVECVVRGYITGSGWDSYKETGAVCGITLPKGLIESQRLPKPIFTPTTKEIKGHDLHISFEVLCDMVGRQMAKLLRQKSIELYLDGSKYAVHRGIIIADTKFEFGLRKDELTLIDEVLTPDSSRFWPVETYQPGGSQPSYDKQYLRDYLSSTRWNKQPPAPALPDEVIRITAEKYQQALQALVG